MSDAVIGAIITGILAVIGSYAGNVAITDKRRREDDIKDAQREQRQNDRMEVIEQKLDEHNGYAQKFGAIEKSITAIQKDIEYLRKEQR